MVVCTVGYERNLNERLYVKDSVQVLVQSNVTVQLRNRYIHGKSRYFHGILEEVGNFEDVVMKGLCVCVGGGGVGWRLGCLG